MASKKILHLICNSHIDPVWQWDWDEGAAAALATFYAACNLLDKYDFIFCHNEVIVYEYIERYDPKLFARIQDLVAKGKWKIMGGWYCQPDCYIPSGESFLRQISIGREYFYDKFNARPTVALNFDSFGHTRGLPEILSKCGFDSYIICRPLPWYVSIPNFKDFPHGTFIWEGYDGSRVKCLRYEDSYCNYTTQLGKAKQNIIQKAEQYIDLNIDEFPVLWGVGNHGGTASEKDLEDIIELQNEKKGEWQLIHSTLEDYFATQHPTQVEKRQIFVFLKAYSSVNAIKLAHDQLENALYFTEKVCSIADLAGKYHYNKEILKKAEKILCQIEFHDVLAGTAIKIGLDSSVRKAHQAIEELKGEMFAAFHALASDLPKVAPGDDNCVFLNPYPYEFEDFVECEIYPNVFFSNFFNEEYDIKLYDLDNKEIEYQIIKEQSNILVQHRVRLLFKAHIPAFSLVSYRAHVEIKPKEERKAEMNGDIVLKDKVKEIVISAKTGLISSYKVNGKEFIDGEASLPVFFSDNCDPWGWRLHDLTCATFNENGWPNTEDKNSLKPMKLDNRKVGLGEGIEGLSYVEHGELLKEVQALFYKDESRVIVNYRIYKDVPYIDINYHVLWNEKQKGLKIKFPLAGSRDYFAQMAFGIEKYKADGIENPSNRYIGNMNGDDAFVIYNKSGIHSVSKKGKNLYVTLLNGASYCAHPTIPELPLTPEGRYDASIEQGVHDFYLRVGVNKIEECERIANEFNQPVYELLYFPHNEKNEVVKDVLTLSNKNIVISALKRRIDGTFLVRLYNGSFNKAETELMVKGVKKNVILKKFEFKTFVFDGKTIVESKDSSIY